MKIALVDSTPQPRFAVDGRFVQIAGYPYSQGVATTAHIYALNISVLCGF